VSAESEPEDEEFTDELKCEIDRRLAASEATGRTATKEEFLTAACGRHGKD